jgi:hypothetical protein
MTVYVLKILERVGGVDVAYGGAIEGQWVKAFRPEAYDGRGFLEGTCRLAEARRFDTAASALAFVVQQPRNRPWRADGGPNRPLTAFTIGIDPVEDESGAAP